MKSNHTILPNESIRTALEKMRASNIKYSLRELKKI